MQRSQNLRSKSFWPKEKMKGFEITVRNLTIQTPVLFDVLKSNRTKLFVHTSWKAEYICSYKSSLTLAPNKLETKLVCKMKITDKTKVFSTQSLPLIRISSYNFTHEWHPANGETRDDYPNIHFAHQPETKPKQKSIKKRTNTLIGSQNPLSRSDNSIRDFPEFLLLLLAQIGTVRCHSLPRTKN